MTHFPFLKDKENNCYYRVVGSLMSCNMKGGYHGTKCMWLSVTMRAPHRHIILCSVLSVTISKCTHIPLHTGPIHSPEPQVAVCQVPENKVPFTLLLSISSSQRALREKKFSEFIAGELRLKTSETTVLRAQSFNHGVKMCTRLWSLCAHLHAWTSPMVIFLSPRTC